MASILAGLLEANQSKENDFGRVMASVGFQGYTNLGGYLRRGAAWCIVLCD